MASRPITSQRILAVLLVGFGLVIVMLAIAAYLGVQRTRQIKESAARLVEEQLLTTRLIDEVQREQSTVSALFLSLAREGQQPTDRGAILLQLNEWEDHTERVVAAAAGTPEAPQWRALERSMRQFTAEARRVLTANARHPGASADLLRYHNQVISDIAKLVNDSYQKAQSAEGLIEVRAEELRFNSLIVLTACLMLAIVCAAMTTRMAAILARRMEWQAGELSRVSWQLLENQETVARRFSHELHDELGQALTAIRANLVALRASPDTSPARLADCERLVEDAIRNVRELSQLLRPTILDDFGLDASLRWLCEGFTQRTGIDVEYSSDFEGRLADETETHLFRIAQEALTNVARHSGAKAVKIALNRRNGSIRLAIEDNGRGTASGRRNGSGGLGMVGMRARARNAGGELVLRSIEGGGLGIEVEVPARDKVHEQENPHFVGR